MLLLWYLGDELELTGTKYGGAAALCGAAPVRLGDSHASQLFELRRHRHRGRGGDRRPAGQVTEGAEHSPGSAPRPSRCPTLNVRSAREEANANAKMDVGWLGGGIGLVVVSCQCRRHWQLQPGYR